MTSVPQAFSSVEKGSDPVMDRLGVLISGRGSNLQAIIDAIQAGRLRARIAVVISNRAAAPGLARGLLVEAIPDDWRDAVARLGCVSLHCSFRHLTMAQARSVKDAGYALLCYTVNDPATVRDLFAWGVDAVVTDRLDLVLPELGVSA